MPLSTTSAHLLEDLWGWRLNFFPGQPVPVFPSPFSEECFRNVQPKLPLAQLEANFSCPKTFLQSCSEKLQSVQLSSYQHLLALLALLQMLERLIHRII